MKTLYIVSVSMGKDSLAMFLGLLEKGYPINIVIFYDSGMEFQAIYHNRDKVKALCEERKIRFVELHPESTFLYNMFDRKVPYRDGSGYHYGYSWCGGSCRWATKHKTEAIRKFKKELLAEYQQRYGYTPRLVDYVGIAADEPKRVEKERRADKVLPLVEWGWTEYFCLRYCRERGWCWLEDSPVTDSGKVELYEILDRASCWCCANKNLKELYNIYHYLPQYWNRLVALQELTDRPFKGYSPKGPVGIMELEQKFKLKEKT